MGDTLEKDWLQQHGSKRAPEPTVWCANFDPPSSPTFLLPQLPVRLCTSASFAKLCLQHRTYWKRDQDTGVDWRMEPDTTDASKVALFTLWASSGLEATDDVAAPPAAARNMAVNKHLADALGMQVVRSYLAHAHGTPATAAVRVAVVQCPPTDAPQALVDVHGVPVVVWSFVQRHMCDSHGVLDGVHFPATHLSPGAAATLRRVLTPASVQQLFRCHTNIAFIVAAGCGDHGQDPAVVIGVSAKGFVPHGEEPLPRHLPVLATDDASATTVPVFVFDGIAEPCTSLGRGDAVSNHDAESFGTLGGVVHLGDGSQRLVTAAHVVCDLEADASTGRPAIRDADGTALVPIMDEDGLAQARLDDGSMKYKRADGAAVTTPRMVPTVDCMPCVSPVLAHLQFHHLLTDSWKFKSPGDLLDQRRARFPELSWSEFYRQCAESDDAYTAPNAALSAMLDGTSKPEHRAVCDVQAAEVLWDTAVPVAGTAGDSADDDGVPT